jgi:hypothetical protein
MYMIMTDRGWRPFHALNERVCVNSNDLQGVYRPATLEQAIASNATRADRWIEAMQHKATRMSQFSGDHFMEPIKGAFGEKL